MHGFLRFDVDGDDPSEEAADQIVLTEQEYFDFFNRPTSLFNYTFLYLLREYPCLFVGLSMVDDNLRRLLYYSRIERESAYRSEGRVNRANKDAIRHFAILAKKPSALATYVEGSLRQLGVTVLWIQSYDEIPHRFEEMYKATGGDWAVVSRPLNNPSSPNATVPMDGCRHR